MQRFTQFVLAVACVVTTLGALSSRATAHDFTWDNLALAHIKLDKNFDIDANVEWYMEEYREATWNLARNDEFLMHEKKIETRKILEERIKSFDVAETFILRADTTVGDYDFTNQEFPRENNGPGSYWYKNEYKGSESIPSTIKLFMKNFDFLHGVPMSPTAARDFIRSRKNRNGYVDRRVYAIIEFRVIKLKEEGELLAEALNVTYYRDSSRRQPLGPKLVWKPKSSTQSAQQVATTASKPTTGDRDLGVVGRR